MSTTGAPLANPDDLRAIRALNGYRWLVAIAASVLFVTGIANELFRILWPALFGSACLAYLSLCVFSAWATHWPRLSLPTQLYLLVGTDIAFVLALVFASDGVSDGIAVLLFAPIAGASLLVPPRTAALFAAVASLGLLVEEGWRYLSYPGEAANWAAAGILGSLLFTVAIIASVVARRARTNATMAAVHRSELKDMTRLNERIIQRMSAGLLVLDAQHRIRSINQAAWELLDLGHSAIGQPLAAAVPVLDQALQAWLVAPNLPCEPQAIGEHRVIPRFSRLDPARAVPVLVFLEDARRIEEQTQQLKLAALGRLTASIAHEIRNPLSAISHAAQLLDESSQLGPEEQRLLAIQHRHTERIDHIVEDILGLSRRGHALTSRLALRSWLPEFVTEYQQTRASATTITVATIAPSLQIRADPKQLAQVLTNLCENAERHSDKKTPTDICIALSAGHTDSGHPYVQVADNGPGIADAAAEKVLEPFFTTAHDGTGLGLYIARELCESNFASFTPVKTASGACFRITFPHPDALERGIPDVLRD